MVFSLTMLPPVGVSLYYGDGSHMSFVAAAAWLVVVGGLIWWPARRDRATCGCATASWSSRCSGRCSDSREPCRSTSRRSRTSARPTRSSRRCRAHHDRRHRAHRPRRAAEVDPLLSPAAAVARGHGHRDPCGGAAAHAGCRWHVALPRRDAGPREGREAHAAHHADGAHAVGGVRDHHPGVCGAYWLAGMGPFDAVGHAFATVAIGGFSHYDASLGISTAARSSWSRCSSC